MSQVKSLSRTLTRHVERQEERQRPLDFRLIMRLLKFTRPYAAKRNWLLLAVLVRSVQLPALTWVVAAVINGPIARRDVTGVIWGAVGFGVLALSTQFVMHFRQRLALELGPSVLRARSAAPWNWGKRSFAISEANCSRIFKRCA